LNCGVLMMIKIVNGVAVEMTPEEIAEYHNAMSRDEARYRIMEKSRPLTEAEVSRMFIAAQINTMAVDDNTALRMLEFYPEWAENTVCTVGFKVRYKGKLWRCIQAHTAIIGWEPDAAESLWEQINETHTGTEDDPIPYSGNMALEMGKYYHQDYVVYLCNRDTGTPVYCPLKELVGIYVVAS